MAARYALCIDEVSCRNPAIIGLDGESLDTQEWLSVFSCGLDIREAVAQGADFKLAWVLSCDDVEPINLAASLKADCPGLRVSLITGDACGSLFSRAHTALIDEVIAPAEFVRRYAQAKRSALQPQPGIALQPFAQPRAEALALRAPGRAFVFPVVSGSGGAGKSAVAMLAALCASRQGRRTLLLDCDLQFGDIAMMAGVESPLCVDTAIAHPEQLEACLAADDKLAVIAAPARLEAAEEAVRGLPQLLSQVSNAFDVVVVNTGAAWAEQHAVLLERSSAALFLIDQRASSVRACRHALELCARCGIATGPFQFALNRCSKTAPLTSIDVSCALQGAPVFELRDGGRDVEDCLSGGVAAELVESRNDFVKSIEYVLERVLPASQRQPAPQAAEPDRRTQRRRGRHGDRKRGWK